MEEAPDLIHGVAQLKSMAVDQASAMVLESDRQCHCDSRGSDQDTLTGFGVFLLPVASFHPTAQVIQSGPGMFG